MVRKVVGEMKEEVYGFLEFIREQGVIGLAIGFILGGAISSVVKSFVENIIEPILGMIIGSSEGLQALAIGPVTYGNFLTAIIDFLIIAGVIYFGFKKLGITGFDRKKEKNQ